MIGGLAYWLAGGLRALGGALLRQRGRGGVDERAVMRIVL